MTTRLEVFDDVHRFAVDQFMERCAFHPRDERA